MKLGGVFFILFSLNIFAQEYAVVSNVLLHDITKSKLKAIFLKKLTHLNKIHLVPVNLSSNNDIREAFEKEILQMSKKRLKSYWSKQHYMGNRPPVTMKSQESVLAFTRNVLGAISYVKIENVNENVNILYKWRSND